MKPGTPPRLAEWLLRRFLPLDGQNDAIRGDLTVLGGANDAIR